MNTTNFTLEALNEENCSRSGSFKKYNAVFRDLIADVATNIKEEELREIYRDYRNKTGKSINTKKLWSTFQKNEMALFGTMLESHYETDAIEKTFSDDNNIKLKPGSLEQEMKWKVLDVKLAMIEKLKELVVRKEEELNDLKKEMSSHNEAAMEINVGLDLSKEETKRLVDEVDKIILKSQNLNFL